MKAFYSGSSQTSEEREIRDRLEKEGITLQDYGTVWASVDGGVSDRRKAILRALKDADAVVVDLSDKTHVPAGAMVIGMAAALDKRLVAIQSNDAQAGSGAQGVLRYSPGDSESMELFMQQLIQHLQGIGDADPAGGSGGAPKIFISYSHQDEEFFKRLMIHLRPLQREGLIDPWSDQRIRPGDQWKKEIDTALHQASIAILLVSADFLASDFIVDNELPPLLKKALASGTRVLPLILTDCRFTRDSSLSAFQAVNDPAKPLATMPLPEREKFYDNLVLEVERSTNPQQ